MIESYLGQIAEKGFIIMNILITGANGFMGRNLAATLSESASGQEHTLLLIDVGASDAQLEAAAAQADFVFHLAGINRPVNEADFQRGNTDFTQHLMGLLDAGKCPPVVISSSTQAEKDNPYGVSKRMAEEAVRDYGKRTGQSVMIYRLTNVFGKWSRPQYNSAVATFCHNIARGLPIQVNDPAALLKLVYIDDVVAEFQRALLGNPTRQGDFCSALPEHSLTLAELTQHLYAFRDSREQCDVIDQSDPLVRKLYATYLSFLPEDDFAKSPIIHADRRGFFAELLHLGGYGQISVNVQKPHIAKGNHWHHTKHEKFVVVSGHGVIRFRKVGCTDILTYPVSGDVPVIVDIPPGYTHNIENLGDTDMVTLMWANERFDPTRTDTFLMPV